jgi:transcriptional regulator with XRE-family HTH domain
MGAGHHPRVDDLKVGAILRAVRLKARLRQVDVAARAGVSQSRVSDVERGRLTSLSIGAVRAIAGALAVRLELLPRWRGGEVDRLLDRAHAAIGEVVIAELRSADFEVLIEYGFNHFGERGSVDIVGWQGSTRALLIIELKSQVFDLQNLHASFGRKARLVPPLLDQERGWAPHSLGRVLVMPSTTVNRSVIERHPQAFGATFPSRTRQIRRWLRSPVGDLAGIWFVRNTAGNDGKCASRATQRVRRRKP